jgi:hypothetical protein
MEDCLELLSKSLDPLMKKLGDHPLYQNITSIKALQHFMEHHVFAVWDFMCLLKELHRRIVSTSAPWFPAKDPLSAHLISSILVDEEGDLAEDGKTYLSHYDLYLQSMKKVGANTAPMSQFLSELRNGVPVEEALNATQINPLAKQFVLSTFSFFELGTHEIAAAFVYGREGITPVIFEPLVNAIKRNFADDSKLSSLIYYFDRHIELDSNQHFDQAKRMLSNLIGNDPRKMEEAKNAAHRALIARLDFLTAICDSIHSEVLIAA